MTEAGPTEPALSLVGISRGFGGVQALEDVSLDARAGEIHCLAGENGSGKSTLIKIVAGVLRPDAGRIRVGGRTLASLTPVASVGLGIQVIYQDLSLFPNLTVAENLALNTLIEHRAWIVRRQAVQDIAERALSGLGLSLDLDRLVGDLPIAERQLVAIARALLADARLVILDEPTTALTSVEIDALFGLVRALVARGVAMLFVSHKMREMLQISHRFTILRNGRVVASGPREAFDEARLAHAMTGRTPGGGRVERQAGAPVGPRLRVTNLTGPTLSGVTFHVDAGEIVGLTGLLGAGQADVALALAGVKAPASGTIEVDGRPRPVRSVADAVGAGIAYVPEDRLSEGLFLGRSVVDNVSAASLRRLAGAAGLISTRRIERDARRWVNDLEVRTPSLFAEVRTLSGGNQQRVVLAKWLETRPRILILDSPTVGVDIRNKHGIYDIVHELAAGNVAILLISDEVPEVYYNSDRVLHMRDGRIVGEYRPPNASEEDLRSAVYA